MSFCTKCGAQLAVGANFCPSCGTPVSASAVATAAVSSSLSVVLSSVGTCDNTDAAILLEQLLGYSTADAATIVANTPMVIAQNLNDEQAATLAEALTEYGMEVAVSDGATYRTVATNYGAVYNTAGNLVASAAAILGALGVANRVTRSMMRRYDYPHGRPPMPHRPHPARPPRMPRPQRPAPRPMMGGGPRPSAARPASPRPQAGGPSRGGMGGPGGRGGQGGPGGRGGQGGPGGRGGMGGPGGRR